MLVFSENILNIIFFILFKDFSVIFILFTPRYPSEAVGISIISKIVGHNVRYSLYILFSYSPAGPSALGRPLGPSGRRGSILISQYV